VLQRIRLVIQRAGVRGTTIGSLHPLLQLTARALLFLDVASCAHEL
jgi:hypothetical protein